MVDFHTHILPEIDDGAEDVRTSLEMLRESWDQGVRMICATPHFYADEDDPGSFFERRYKAYDKILEAIETLDEVPEILLGAEVLYFPGISVADELRAMCIGNSPFLLIEPPMIPWSESMLDEIEQCGHTLCCIPVIAHLDRYMRMLRDLRLFDRIKGRRILIQVNGSFFLNHSSTDMALRFLSEGSFHFIGSDCHDLRERYPNLGDVESVIAGAGLKEVFDHFNDTVYDVLTSGNVNG